MCFQAIEYFKISTKMTNLIESSQKKNSFLSACVFE